MVKKKIIFKTIILLIWMTIIYLLSNQNGTDSGNLSSGLLYNIFKIFHISDSLINDFFLVLIRKLAHFTEYLILSILFTSLLKELKVEKEFHLSILLCLLYASLDEIHQLFVSARAGSIIDVGVDFLGSLGGLFIYYIVVKYKRKNK